VGEIRLFHGLRPASRAGSVAAVSAKSKSYRFTLCYARLHLLRRKGARYEFPPRLLLFSRASRTNVKAVRVCISLMPASGAFKPGATAVRYTLAYRRAFSAAAAAASQLMTIALHTRRSFSHRHAALRGRAIRYNLLRGWATAALPPLPPAKVFPPPASLALYP
jgi:hypothetical protein